MNENISDSLVIPIVDGKNTNGKANDTVIEGTSKKVGTGLNKYRNKKTATQGMLNIALFSAHTNQLRLTFSQILDGSYKDPIEAYMTLIMLLVSLTLQVGVGVVLIRSVRYNIKENKDRDEAYKQGRYVLLGTFLITFVNTFIMAFGASGS